MVLDGSDLYADYLLGFSYNVFFINVLFFNKIKIIKTKTYFTCDHGSASQLKVQKSPAKKIVPIWVVSKSSEIKIERKKIFNQSNIQNLWRRIYIFLLYEFSWLEVALPAFLFRFTCTGSRESTMHIVTSLLIAT